MSTQDVRLNALEQSRKRRDEMLGNALSVRMRSVARRGRMARRSGRQESAEAARVLGPRGVTDGGTLDAIGRAQVADDSTIDRVQNQLFDAQRFASRAPATTKWLLNEGRELELSQDDLDRMEEIEAAVRGVGQPNDWSKLVYDSGRSGVRQLVFEANALGGIYGFGDPADAAKEIATAWREREEAAARLPASIELTNALLEAPLADVDRAATAYFDAAIGPARVNRLGIEAGERALETATRQGNLTTTQSVITSMVLRTVEVLDVLENIDKADPLGDDAAMALGGAGAALFRTIAAGQQAPEGGVPAWIVNEAVRTTVQSSPATGAALLGFLGSGLNPLGAGFAGAAGGAYVETAAYVAAELEERTGGVADEQLILEALTDPQFIADVKARGLAKGLTSGIVEGVFSSIAGGRVAKALPGGKRTPLLSPDGAPASRQLGRALGSRVQQVRTGASELAGRVRSAAGAGVRQGGRELARDAAGAARAALPSRGDALALVGAGGAELAEQAIGEGLAEGVSSFVADGEVSASDVLLEMALSGPGSVTQIVPSAVLRNVQELAVQIHAARHASTQFEAAATAVAETELARTSPVAAEELTRRLFEARSERLVPVPVSALREAAEAADTTFDAVASALELEPEAVRTATADTGFVAVPPSRLMSVDPSLRSTLLPHADLTGQGSLRDLELAADELVNEMEELGANQTDREEEIRAELAALEDRAVELGIEGDPAGGDADDGSAVVGVGAEQLVTGGPVVSQPPLEDGDRGSAEQGELEAAVETAEQSLGIDGTPSDPVTPTSEQDEPQQIMARMRELRAELARVESSRPLTDDDAQTAELERLTSGFVDAGIEPDRARLIAEIPVNALRVMAERTGLSFADIARGAQLRAQRTQRRAPPPATSTEETTQQPVERDLFSSAGIEGMVRSERLGGELEVITGLHRHEGRYAIIDASAIRPSHLVDEGEDGQRFRVRADYPAGLQPRPYHERPAEAAKVERFAVELPDNAALFLGTGATATDGPPVISPDGFVINGNGRAMAQQLAARLGNLGPYDEALRQSLGTYGLDDAALEGVAQPLLVRVVNIDASSPTALEFARAGNESLTQAQSLEDRMDALAASLPGDVFAISVPEDSTLPEVLNGESAAAREVLITVHDALPPNIRPEFFEDTGELNTIGREALTQVLVSRYVDRGLYQRSPSRVREMLVKGLPQLASIELDVHPALQVRGALDEALTFGLEELNGWRDPLEQAGLGFADGAFGELSDGAQGLVRAISPNLRRTTTLRALFGAYLPAAQSSEFFGEVKATTGEVVAQAAEKVAADAAAEAAAKRSGRSGDVGASDSSALRAGRARLTDVQLEELEAELVVGDVVPLDDEDLAAILRGDEAEGSVSLEPGDRVVNLLEGYTSGDLSAVIPTHGAKVRHATDAAALLAAYRSPFVERLSWLVHDADGNVKAHGLYSIGTLTSAASPTGLDLFDIMHGADIVPGDTFVVAHNHPSGNVTPSAADRGAYGHLSKAATSRGAHFSGLILNGDKFAVLEARARRTVDEGTGETFVWDEVDATREREFVQVEYDAGEHAGDFRRVDVVTAASSNVARQFKLGPDESIVIGLSELGVTSIEAFAGVPTPEQLELSLRRGGANAAVVAASPHLVDDDVRRALVATGLVNDVVTVEGRVVSSSIDESNDTEVVDALIERTGARLPAPGVARSGTLEGTNEAGSQVVEAGPSPGEIDVDGVMRPTQNADGQPIHSTAAGVVAFWRWFGDSQTVDADGRPLVLYHGTGEADGFVAFRPDLTGRGNDQLGSGFYTTRDRDEASTYTTAVTGNVADGTRKLGGDGTPGVMPLYVRVTDPIVVNGSNLFDSDVDLTHEQAAQLIASAPNVRDPELTPLVDWHDVSVGVEDWMIEDVASSYEGSSLASLESDFYARGGSSAEGATRFREAVTDVLGRDGVFLNIGGEDARHVVAFAPGQLKSAIGNDGTFDAGDPAIVSQPGDSDARGELSIPGPDGPMGQVSRAFDMTLWEESDATTPLHEMGHYFLETMSMVARAAPDSSVARDFDAVLREVSVPGETADARLEAWGARLQQDEAGDWSLDESARSWHESFAEAFEDYLHRGRAPSARLRAVFGVFRAWFGKVYGALRRNGREINPTLADVFDRLLATDDEIASARGLGAARSVFGTAEQAGMSDDEWTEHKALEAEMIDGATNDMDVALLEALNAETKKARDERRATIRGQVVAELHARPSTRLLWLMRHGTSPDGSELPAGLASFKLDKDDVAQYFGQGSELVTRLGRMRLLAGDAETSMPLDQVATMFGFDSPTSVVVALSGLANFDELVSVTTEAQLAAENPDLALHPLKRASAASVALENRRQEFAVRELEAMNRLVREQRRDTQRAQDQDTRRSVREREGFGEIRVETLKKRARKILSTKMIRELSPSTYFRKMKAADTQARKALARGDALAAQRAVAQRMLHLELFSLAKSMLERSEADINRLKRAAAPSSIKAVGLESRSHRDALIDLVTLLDLRKSTTNKKIDNELRLRRWVEGQDTIGLPIDIDDALIARASRKHWRTLTVEELGSLADAARMIQKRAAFKNRLRLLAEQRELKATAQAVAASIASSRNDVAVSEDMQRADRTLRTDSDELLIGMRKLGSMMREMDGGEFGTLTRLVNGSLNDADAIRNERMRTETATVADIRSRHLTKNERRLWNFTQKRHIPGLIGLEDPKGRPGRTEVSLEEAIAMALHWGNEGNRQRLMEDWTAEQVAVVLSTLEARHLRMVNEIVAHLETFWPEVSSHFEEMNGVRPAKVEATPFEVITADGEVVQMTGGYFTISYADLKQDELDIATAVDDAKRGMAMSSMTANGHTETREAKVTGRKLSLDLDVYTNHISQVVHDLTHRGTILELNKLLGHEAVKGAIVKHYGFHTYKTITSTIADIATRGHREQEWGGRVLRHFRMGTTVVALAWSAKTIMMQGTGLGTTLTRVSPRRIWQAQARLYGRGRGQYKKTREWIESVSPTMKQRTASWNREVSEQAANATFREALHESVKGLVIPPDRLAKLEATYFSTIATMQYQVDLATWMGSFIEAQESGVDRATAIRMADQNVIDTQVSGSTKDLTKHQRGSEAFKLWNMFASYFSVMFNLNYDRWRDAKAGRVSWPIFIRDMVVWNLTPAMMSALVAFSALKLRGDDEEELTDLIMKEFGSQLFGQVPGGSQFMSAMNGFGAGAPGFRAIEESARIVGSFDDWLDGDIDRDDFKALNNVGGILLHYPAGFVNKAVDGTLDWLSGDATVAAPLFGGKPGR